MMKTRTSHVVAVVVVAIVLWWLLKPADHKAVHGDVQLGEPTVVAADPFAQAGASDYYTSSTPGSFD